jgi:hypothetical protein
MQAAIAFLFYKHLPRPWPAAQALQLIDCYLALFREEDPPCNLDLGDEVCQSIPTALSFPCACCSSSLDAVLHKMAMKSLRHGQPTDAKLS